MIFPARNLHLEWEFSSSLCKSLPLRVTAKTYGIMLVYLGYDMGTFSGIFMGHLLEY